MTTNVVRCVCGNVEVSGTYEVNGRSLVITSRLGVAKAVVGLQDPRKLAARLLKNTCKRVLAEEPVRQPVGPPTALTRAKERVDAQRDKLGTMAPDDPLRASEERMLDQMIETSRIVESAGVLLKPPRETDDAGVTDAPIITAQP